MRLNNLKPFAIDQQALWPEADADKRRGTEVLERERLNAVREVRIRENIDIDAEVVRLPTAAVLLCAGNDHAHLSR